MIFALLCTGVFLANATWHTLAATIAVKAKVSAPLLTRASTFARLVNGATVTTSPINVTGTCPDSSYVTLSRNATFSGVAACVNQQFSITSDLFIGTNQLVAQDFNQTDDPGPSSPAVSVTYAPITPVSLIVPAMPDAGPIFPLLLTTAYTYQVRQVEQSFTWAVSVSGGTAPYSLSIHWGDQQSAQPAVASGQAVSLTHAYTTPGNHIVMITATDARQQQAHLQLVAIVRNTDVLAATSGGITPLARSPWLAIAVPAYVTVSLMTASFWLGEKEAYRFIWPRKRPSMPRHS